MGALLGIASMGLVGVSLFAEGPALRVLPPAGVIVTPAAPEGSEAALPNP